jgi:hypothetical protein
VDAKYIKGMLSNPDIQPNAAMNRWLAGIALFDFKLRHVPGTKHLGPDGLSRRPTAENDEEEETSEEVEDWLDEVLGCSIWAGKDLGSRETGMMRNSFVFAASGMPNCLPDLQIPVDSTTVQRDQDLHDICSFLETLTISAAISPSLHPQFIK